MRGLREQEDKKGLRELAGRLLRSTGEIDTASKLRIIERFYEGLNYKKSFKIVTGFDWLNEYSLVLFKLFVFAIFLLLMVALYTSVCFFFGEGGSLPFNFVNVGKLS